MQFPSLNHVTMSSVMEELKYEVEALKGKIQEKEEQIQALKGALSQLEERLYRMMEEKQTEAQQEEETRKAEQEAERLRKQEQARLAAEVEAQRKAEEEKQRQEALRQQQEAQAREEAKRAEQEKPRSETQELPTSTAEETTGEESEQTPSSTIGPSEHEAIMRTIEELSKPMGASAQPSAEDRFFDRPSLGDKMAKSHVNDLKRAMGVNERFLYTNELFHGDMGAFSRAVDELNHVETEQDANRLLDEDLAQKYRWDDENETVAAFKSLVSRRFA